MSVWDHVADPETYARLVQHKSHRGVVRTIAELIGEVRAVSEREGLRAVQERLIAALAEAERRFGDARRLTKRGGGDPIDEIFWRRTCVQLRSVGDAIAWRFLNYRRRWIHLFGANQAPGLLSTKEGFADEWQVFQQHWDDGEPTLLAGATNCIRLGDVLVAKGEKLEAIEVKHDPKKFGGKQKRRLQELVRQINEGAPIGGSTSEGWIVESRVPYASHWSRAETHIERAFQDGFASWVPEQGVGVMFMAWRTAALRGQEGAISVQLREQQAAAAAIGPGVHKILLRSYDFPFRSQWSAPMSVFPISPDAAAMLITGELMATIEIHVEAMVEALRANGLHAGNLLESLTSAEALPQRLISWPGPRPGAVLKHTMEQLGIELTDLGVWAEALAITPPPAGAPPKWTGGLCMSKEDSVWM